MSRTEIEDALRRARRAVDNCRHRIARGERDGGDRWGPDRKLPRLRVRMVELEVEVRRLETLLKETTW